MWTLLFLFVIKPARPRFSPANTLWVLSCLDELLESTVDGGSDVGDSLPEVNGGQGPLGNTLRGELELLLTGVSLHASVGMQPRWVARLTL